MPNKVDRRYDATKAVLRPRVEGKNYTRSEWKRCEYTLEVSGKDVKTHSKPNEFKISSGEDLKVQKAVIEKRNQNIDYLADRIARVRGLTVVSDYYDYIGTYSRIGLLRLYGNLQSYWATTILFKVTVVLHNITFRFKPSVRRFSALKRVNTYRARPSSLRKGCGSLTRDAYSY